MFTLSDYDYKLPKQLIAQVPCENRSASKLLHLGRDSGERGHHHFKDIPSLLKTDDLLVVNNTRVIPARLFGKKETGGRVEILIIDYAGGMKHLETSGSFTCECLVKASKGPKKGACILLEDGFTALVEKTEGYVSLIRFSNGRDIIAYIKQKGRMPLPPYIKRPGQGAGQASGQNDREDYQTVYASREGAVAAPTAGLHFTGELIHDLKVKGIELAEVTLHVGYGTFVPVRVEDIREHQIHTEAFCLSKASADKINAAKQQNRRVIAVGTTSVRTLEYLSDERGMVTPGDGYCDLFIYPGYTFTCVDAMITNFHLPESTLLMLVSAFAGRKNILSAYRDAIKKKYRFFSYGDAMLIQ